MRGARAALASTLLCAAACGGDAPADADPSEPPVLTVPVVDLAAVTEFVGFGAENVGGPAAGGSALVPAWELRTGDRTLTVRAPCAGEVARVFDNPREADVEIHLRPDPDGAWLIILDHVLEARVAVGDRLAPGDALGLIGHRGETQGRVELQVQHDAPDGSRAVCPSSVGTPAFVAAHEAARAAADAASPRLCLLESLEP